MPALDLGPAAAQVARLVDGVADEQLGSPTLCAGTPVAGLLDHILGLTTAFTWAAQKATPDGGSGSPRASADHLDPAWRTLVPAQLDALAEAWRDPSAVEGMAEAGGVSMPAEIMNLVALDELVLHGWDLAQATGQPFGCDPASTAAVLEFTRGSAEPAAAAQRADLFGPVVDVGADATPFDRALGFAGRDPAWTPSSSR